MCACYILCAVMQTLRVINMMRTVRARPKVRLDLEGLHRALGGRLYQGRPEMLLVPMTNGRRIQIFRGGSVQILGRLPHAEAEAMRDELMRRLRGLSTPLLRILRTTPLEISNLVLQARFPPPRLKHAASNKHVFCEAEIFPAVLIRRWAPAHVAVFHNGKIIITGVKSQDSCESLLTDLKTFLQIKPNP